MCIIHKRLTGKVSFMYSINYLIIAFHANANMSSICLEEISTSISLLIISFNFKSLVILKC